ncbi:hypothetical protein Tco_0701248 [Tanacetum coccineum]
MRINKYGKSNAIALEDLILSAGNPIEEIDDVLTEMELKQIEADAQAIQTILLGLPEDIYAAIDKKKAKLFNDWKRFTSTDGELIESYYHRFLNLMNDFKRNKHFPEKITSNLKNQVVQNVVQNLGVQNVGNQNGLIVVPRIANQNPNGNGNVAAAQAEGNATGNNSNQIRLVEVHNYDNCYDNEIFNIFTQEEQYTELLEPIPEPHQVQLNDSNVISKVSSMEQDGGIVDQHPATIEETSAYFESLYNNLAIEVEKVNSGNHKMKETNADLTTKLPRYKNQEKCFEISQEKYGKLKRCYQKSVYREQCLTKKINALHLSSDKQITTLNEEISNLNKQLSMENNSVLLLKKEKVLKSGF